MGLPVTGLGAEMELAIQNKDEGPMSKTGGIMSREWFEEMFRKVLIKQGYTEEEADAIIELTRKYPLRKIIVAFNSIKRDIILRKRKISLEEFEKIIKKVRY